MVLSLRSNSASKLFAADGVLRKLSPFDLQQSL
jgi:hypothetical protein